MVISILNQKLIQMLKARYIRQSTSQQSNLRQLAKAHPDEKLFIDTISGSVPFDERPQGKLLIDAVSAGEVSYISFHAIDRAGRNTINVLQTLQFFFDKRVIVKSYLSMNFLCIKVSSGLTPKTTASKSS